MIWNSVFLMTVIDLAILGVAGGALAIFFSFGRHLAVSKTRWGFTAITVGLALVGGFHLVDLVTMHVLPMFMPMADAMGIMRSLHLNYRWIVSLLGVGSIATGFAVVSQGVRGLIDRLRRSERDLQTELAERRRAEDALRRSEQRFALILENSPCAIFLKDNEGYFQLANRRFSEWYGVSPTDIAGRSTYDIYPKAFADAYVAQDREVLACGKTVEREHEVVFSDASVHSVLVTKFPVFDDAGASVGIGTIHVDVTERNGVAQELNAAKEQAELANKAKSEFLANMSHELRTPLNAIIGFSQIIKDQTFGPVGNSRYCEYAGDIHDSGEHLLDLINDILDLSKIESGAIEIHEEDVDVAAVVQSVMTLLKKRAESGRLDVKIDMPVETPPLYADARSVKQMLVNLLSNAIKFTQPHGCVTLNVWSNMHGYVLQVADTGIGIALSDIPKALSKFGQVDGELARQYDGTGLGLPLTKTLVELHGGSFDLQSELGVGTTATIRFPAERIVSSPCDQRIARPSAVFAPA